MKRYIFFLFFVLVAAPVAFADKATAAAGFRGPGQEVSTVEQAKQMKDDAWVTLQGNIERGMGDDKYLFRDATGAVQVEVEFEAWGGQEITPNDRVELHGKLDKDSDGAAIEVKRVIKMQ